MPRYSSVVPIYNDGYLAEAFCHNFAEVMSAYLKLSQIDESVELTLVNDGSLDNSQEFPTEVCRTRLPWRMLFASMNFPTGSRRPTDLAALRVMTRRFVDAYNRLTERGLSAPGLEATA